MLASSTFDEITAVNHSHGTADILVLMFGHRDQAFMHEPSNLMNLLFTLEGLCGIP